MDRWQCVVWEALKDKYPEIVLKQAINICMWMKMPYEWAIWQVEHICEEIMIAVKETANAEAHA